MPQATTDSTSVIQLPELKETSERLLAGDFEFFFPYFIKLGQAILILIIFWLAYRILYALFSKLLISSSRVDVGVRQLLLKTFKVVMVVFAIITSLSQMINVTPLIAGFSVVGIAVGFAAQDTIQNFISGVTILIDQPFRVGDNIIVEDTFGTVHEITLRSTRLKSMNNEIIVLPNAQLINQKVVNHTMLDTLRLEVPFGIAYKEFPQDARKVVLATTVGDEDLLKIPAPSVIVTSLNDSSVDMNLRVWISNPKQEIEIRARYIEKIREALREANIEIPFPHVQLAIDEAKAFEEFPLFRGQA